MDFVGVIKSIYEVISIIKNLAETAQSNKEQCKRLGKRCDILMTAMRPLESNIATYSEALIKTKRVVEEIRDFIMKFRGPFKIMDKLHLMRTSTADREEFSNLNNKLSQSSDDLKLGVLVDTRERSHQDILDVRADMNEIKDMIATLSEGVRENAELTQSFQQSVQIFNAAHHDWQKMDEKLTALQEQMCHVVALLHQSSASATHPDAGSNTQVMAQLLLLRKLVEDTATDSASSRQHIALLCDISTQVQQAVTTSHEHIRSHVSTEMQRLRAASESLKQVHNEHHHEQMRMLNIIFNKLESPTQLQDTHHQQVLRGLLLADHSISVTDTRIGKGGFGSVFMGTCNGSSVAVKILFYDARTPNQLKQQQRAVESEVLLMHSSKHPCVIAVYGYVHSPARNGSLMAMELASRGSLGDLLTYLRYEDMGSLPLSLAVAWVRDIAHALAFLHSKKIVHRDIKAENVLLTENLHCKLTDFGLAREQRSSALGLPSTVGTLVFMAPEIKTNQGGNHRSDVYSLGVTTVQIFTRQTPSALDSTATLISNALHVYHLPVRISSPLRTCLAGCLSLEVAHRYSAEDAVRGLHGVQALVGGDPRERAVGHVDGAQIRALDDIARDRFYSDSIMSSSSLPSPQSPFTNGVTDVAGTSTATATSDESMSDNAGTRSELYQWLKDTCCQIMRVNVTATHIAKIEEVLNEEYIYSVVDVHTLGEYITDEQYRANNIPARLAKAVLQGIQVLPKRYAEEGETSSVLMCRARQGNVDAWQDLERLSQKSILFAKCYLSILLIRSQVSSIPKDVSRGQNMLEEVIPWLQSNAVAEHARKHFSFLLGWCYNAGIGVAQDHGEATRYYRIAADQGFALAQSNLGVCYEKGTGVTQDYSEAARLYSLAADQGFDTARLTKDIIRLKQALTGDAEAEIETEAARLRSPLYIWLQEALYGVSPGAIASTYNKLQSMHLLNIEDIVQSNLFTQDNPDKTVDIPLSIWKQVRLALKEHIHLAPPPPPRAMTRLTISNHVDWDRFLNDGDGFLVDGEYLTDAPDVVNVKVKFASADQLQKEYAKLRFLYEKNSECFVKAYDLLELGDINFTSIGSGQHPLGLMAMVMEAGSFTLTDHLRKELLRGNSKLDICSHLVNIVTAAHANNIVLLNLTSDNIVFVAQEAGSISRKVFLGYNCLQAGADVPLAGAFGKTVAYWAPEFFHSAAGLRADMSMDIWALGMLVFFLFHKERETFWTAQGIVRGADVQSKMEVILADYGLNAKRAQDIRIDRVVDYTFADESQRFVRDFLKICLRIDPHTRTSASVLKEKVTEEKDRLRRRVVDMPSFSFSGLSRLSGLSTQLQQLEADRAAELAKINQETVEDISGKLDKLIFSASCRR